MRPAMENALREPRTESRTAGGTPAAAAEGISSGPVAADPHANVRFSASRFRNRRVHFIGIGGSGMSGLASMLLDSGAVVSGSELKPNPQTFELSRRGARISRDQIGELLTPEVDLVVRTAAVSDTNREF